MILPGTERIGFATRLIALLALASGLAGCAVRYSDAGGRLHTLGLVWQTTAPVAPPAGDDRVPRFTFRFGPLHDSAALLRQRTLGALLSWTDFSRGLTLGYSEQLVVLPAESPGLTAVDFDSSAPLAAQLTFQPFRGSLLPAASPHEPPRPY